MIDPQTQGNKWIKNYERKNDLVTIKIRESSTKDSKESKDLVRLIESCVENGKPLLVEDVHEKIDNVLDPIIT